MQYVKSITCVASVLLVAAVGVTCGSPSEGPEGSEPAPQSRFLSVGTAPPGGAFFVVGGALSEVLNAHLGARGWRFTSEATKGSQENIRRLSAGELDFALANAAISYFGVRGESGWEQAYDVRTVMTLAPNVALFVTPAESDIQELADIKGKRIVVGPAGAGFEYFLRPILGAHGVTYEDFTPLNGTQAGAVDLLADGSAAAAFLGGAVPTASITQASSSQDLYFVPYDESAMAELLESYPFFGRATIPAGTYRDLDEDYHGLNVGSMQLITSASVDDEVVYQATKVIYENRSEVVERHAAGKAIQPGNVVRDTGTPFHPGAIRFYREIGIWPKESAEPTEPVEPAEPVDAQETHEP